MTAAMPTDAGTWWLRMALGDLAAARALLEAQGVAPRQAACLAQQAAEKALKACIALQGSEPPTTQDLLFLLQRAPGEASLRNLPIDLVALSGAQTAARYPDLDDPPYDRAEAGRLVEDAACLVAAVLHSFDRRGLAGGGLEPA